MIGRNMRAHLLIAFLTIFCLLASSSVVSSATKETILPLVGEDHRYSIDFLAFHDLAEGALRFAAEARPGRYRAELEAKTLGVAAWLTGDRTQRYVSVMEEAGDGSLRSVNYESTVLKRKNGQWTHRVKRYRFDYQARKVHYDQSDGGAFSHAKEYPLPPGQSPVDILTGFYNLRLGVYGALVPGARLQIPTFTSRGISTISVEVLADAARPQNPFFPAVGTLLRVTVDPEVFNTGDTGLYAYLDTNGRPSHGIVENVIGMGDVYGYLRQSFESANDKGGRSSPSPLVTRIDSAQGL